MTDLNDFFAKKDRKKKRAAAAKSAQQAVAAQNDGTTGLTTTASTNGPAVAQKSDLANQRNNAGASIASVVAQQQTSAADDGWIEIEDPRGSQVYTGGRTVTELKRDNEEKDVSGENTTQTERFSGWGVKPNNTQPSTATTTSDSTMNEEGDAEASPGKGSTDPNPVAAPSPAPVQTPLMMNEAAYPSLADAAKVQTVTPASAHPSSGGTDPSRRMPTSGWGSGGGMSRYSPRAPTTSSFGPARERPRFNINTETLRKKLEQRASENSPQKS